MAKARCPITRPEFLAKASALNIVVDGQTLSAAPREFSTGSFGWFLNGKLTLQVDGKALPVQVSANFTVVGSKDLPKDEAASAAPASADPAKEPAT